MSLGLGLGLDNNNINTRANANTPTTYTEDINKTVNEVPLVDVPLVTTVDKNMGALFEAPTTSKISSSEVVNNSSINQQAQTVPTTAPITNNTNTINIQRKKNLANKYRPQKWNDLVEQDAIKQILSYELKTGNLKRCMLFTGGAGTGKTTSARIFANEIESVHANIFEINCADNTGVDDVRKLLIEPSQVKPLTGKYKIFILDECHMLTTQSQNALLKILEEPPSYCVYILCTTDPQKVLPTIMSRTVRYDFQLISSKGILDRLLYILESEKNSTDGVPVESWSIDALELLTESCSGHLRNAVISLEKVLSFTKNITIADVEKVLGVTSYDILFDVLNSILNKDSNLLLSQIDTVAKSGMDLKLFVKNFLSFVLEVNKYLILKISGNINSPMELLTLPKSFETRLNVYNISHKDTLKLLLKILVELNSNLKWETDVRPVLETQLLLMVI